MADAAPAAPGAPAARFVVRRSRWFLGANLVVAAVLFALVVLNAAYQWQTGGSIAVAALFTVLVAVYFGQTIRQFLVRAPVLIADSAGLALPTVLERPIPWPLVGGATPGGWPTRSQIDLDLPAEVVGTMTLGQRFLGDPVIKRRGLAPGITIVTRGLDRDAATLLAAICAFTRPPDGPGPFVGSTSRE